jgi:hypothetical protein
VLLNPFRYLAGLTNCKEASRLLSRAQEKTLSRRDRLRLWFHVRRCMACQRYQRQIAFLRAASRRFRS